MDQNCGKRKANTSDTENADTVQKKLKGKFFQF